jgi:prepilin-type N-terminal cleavage/methylation domain-containing protein
MEYHEMKKQGQKGFTLLEVSIATALAALGIMATLQMRAAQTQIDTARSVAQVYERLNNAAGSYMTLYYKELIDKARGNPGCGMPAYQIPTDGILDVVKHGSDCKIELTVNGQSKTIDNYLQPRPGELAKLGLLTAADGNYEEKLPIQSYAIAGGSLSSSMVSYNTSNDPTFGANFLPARNGMAVLIQLMCIHPNSVGDFPVVSMDACKSNTYDLRSLVYNIQPYTDLGDNQTLLYRVMEAAGAGRTYLSDTRYGGQLRSDGGVSTLDNPIKLRNSNDGPPFILAIRNGYGSSGQDVFVRRDGSTTLKGDWGVGGQQSITGINTLAANNLAVTGQVGANNILTNSATVTGALGAGSISAGSVSADSVSAGSVFGNTVSGLTGVFGNFLGNTRAALNATTAYFSGDVTTDGDLSVSGATKLSRDLTVAGASKLNNDLTVAGATRLTGGTKVSDFRLENEAVLGGACISSTQTLARAASTSSDYGNSLRLLVCDPVTSTWVRPQKDYRDEIKITNENLNSVSQNVGSNTNDIKKLGDRVAKVEGEYMTWDFINVTWSKVSSSGMPSSNVWKKTPFQCTNIGGNIGGSGVGLPVYGGEAGVRWKQYASDIQKGLAGSSYTPPILIGFDNTPNEEVVYDINCENGYWYVGISTKASNIAGGNICRDGLIRPIYTSSPCDEQPFNLSTPSYNKQVMAARFIAFTRKP